MSLLRLQNPSFLNRQQAASTLCSSRRSCRVQTCFCIAWNWAAVPASTLKEHCLWRCLIVSSPTMRKALGMGPRAFAKMDDGAPASSPAPLKPTKLEMFHELRPFLLPKFGHLRIRILVVFSLIIGVRACNIYIPILFKDTIDSLSAVNPSLPVFSIALYASLRFLVSIQRDIRSLFWLPVEQYTRRSISLYVFRHLHSLSLRFHLNRKTVH